MILTITKGAHWRNTHLPALGEDRQFAHIFDADEPEDVPHQASNFITYANALGHSHGPHVLIMAPKVPSPSALELRGPRQAERLGDDCEHGHRGKGRDTVIALFGVTVHTTGVNLDGVLANVASITIILGSFLAIVVRSIKRSVKDQITDVIGTQVTPILEQQASRTRLNATTTPASPAWRASKKGKKYAVAAVGVTTVDHKKP